MAREDVLRAIKDAEIEATATLSDAKKEASQIVSQARQNASEILTSGKEILAFSTSCLKSSITC